MNLRRRSDEKYEALHMCRQTVESFFIPDPRYVDEQGWVVAVAESKLVPWLCSICDKFAPKTHMRKRDTSIKMLHRSTFKRENEWKTSIRKRGTSQKQNEMQRSCENRVQAPAPSLCAHCDIRSQSFSVANVALEPRAPSGSMA